MSWIDGILSKKLGLNEADGSTLELIRSADTLAIMKRPEFLSNNIEIKAIQSIDPKVSEIALLQRVSSLAALDDTPLGQAILSVAKNKKIELLAATQIRKLDGGISAFIMDRKMILGSPQCLKKEGINLGPLQALTTALIKDGQAVAVVSAEAKPIGLVSAHTPLKPEILDMIKPFENDGLKIHWATPFDENVAFEFRHEGKALASGKDLASIAPCLKLARGIGAKKKLAWIISFLFIGGGVGLFFGLDLIEGLLGAVALAVINLIVFPIWKGTQLMRGAVNLSKP